MVASSQLINSNTVDGRARSHFPRNVSDQFYSVANAAVRARSKTNSFLWDATGGQTWQGNAPFEFEGFVYASALSHVFVTIDATDGTVVGGGAFGDAIAAAAIQGGMLKVRRHPGHRAIITQFVGFTDTFYAGDADAKTQLDSFPVATASNTQGQTDYDELGRLHFAYNAGGGTPTGKLWMGTLIGSDITQVYAVDIGSRYNNLRDIHWWPVHEGGEGVLLVHANGWIGKWNPTTQSFVEEFQYTTNTPNDHPQQFQAGPTGPLIVLGDGGAAGNWHLIDLRTPMKIVRTYTKATNWGALPTLLQSMYSPILGAFYVLSATVDNNYLLFLDDNLYIQGDMSAVGMNLTYTPSAAASPENVGDQGLCRVTGGVTGDKDGVEIIFLDELDIPPNVFLETKDLDMGDNRLAKTLQAIVFSIDTDGGGGADLPTLILKHRERIGAAFTSELGKSIAVDQKHVSYRVKDNYFRLRFEDAIGSTRWRLARIEIYGATSGARRLR